MSVYLYTVFSHLCRICEIAGEDWENAVEIDRNNSNLEDKGVANQNLTTADIELLKAQGKTGDEIVAALTQNSATFQQKTQFSQVLFHFVARNFLLAIFLKICHGPAGAEGRVLMLPNVYSKRLLAQGSRCLHISVCPQHHEAPRKNQYFRRRSIRGRKPKSIHPMSLPCARLRSPWPNSTSTRSQSRLAGCGQTVWQYCFPWPTSALAAGL